MYQYSPHFPQFLAKPINFLPSKLHAIAITKISNQLMEIPLKEGELDFLQNSSVSVEISDLNLRFAFSLEQGKLVARNWQIGDDLNLKGSLYDFLLLANREEDTDTLFFQRRLKMEGNTELGLEVKNFLDGLEIETIRYHRTLDFILKRSIGIFRWF
jgi:predicted lipid carrier protein YhbT